MISCEMRVPERRGSVHRPNVTPVLYFNLTVTDGFVMLDRIALMTDSAVTGTTTGAVTIVGKLTERTGI